MKDWQPKRMANDGILTLVTDYTGRNPKETHITCSEGDTVFIRQENWKESVQNVALDREQLYNLIFNFMSADELVKIANLKINPDYELEVVKK